jgi:NitT/TauT family transport system permease protein
VTPVARPGWTRWGRWAVLPAVLLAAWEVVAGSRLGDPLYTPSLAAIGAAFARLITTGELALHLQASLGRVLYGFTLAMALAVPLGLAVGWVPALRRHAAPVFELLRPFPSITLVPAAILWFGIGESSKVFLVAYACFWPTFLNTRLGVQEVDPVLVRAARVMEIRGLALVAKVILPAALPSVITGVRISLGVSVIVLLVSEMIGASSGLGFMILDAERNFLTTKMFAGIATMGLLGAGLNLAALAGGRLLLRHRH